MQDDKHKGIEMKWLSGPRTCRFGRRHSDRWSHARSGNFTGCFSSSRTSPCRLLAWWLKNYKAISQL